MSFYVGQKVVCVNDEGMDRAILLAFLSDLVVKGRVYTVRGIIPPTSCSPEFGVTLEEIKGEIHILSGYEFSFHVYRFRPVVERKTDISVFTKMLRTEEIEA